MRQGTAEKEGKDLLFLIVAFILHKFSSISTISSVILSMINVTNAVNTISIKCDQYDADTSRK